MIKNPRYQYEDNPPRLVARWHELSRSAAHQVLAELSELVTPATGWRIRRDSVHDQPGKGKRTSVLLVLVPSIPPGGAIAWLSQDHLESKITRIVQAGKLRFGLQDD